MNIQPLENLARTHTCGELGIADAGKDVVLLGWVHRIRDLGSLAFIDIRDRHGVTQVVARDNKALVEAVQELRPEYVVAVIGRSISIAPVFSFGLTDSAERCSTRPITATTYSGRSSCTAPTTA